MIEFMSLKDTCHFVKYTTLLDGKKGLRYTKTCVHEQTQFCILNVCLLHVFFYFIDIIFFCMPTKLPLFLFVFVLCLFCKSEFFFCLFL